MEISPSNEVGVMGRIKALPWRLCAKIADIARKGKKIAQDDPRRLVHSIRVGLAITSVSLFYYFDPLYKGFSDSAMWAVLTVVVVFEFYVGATLGRGLNRGLATFVAGSLGFGAHRLASLAGQQGEPILLSSFIFILAAVMTFARFFPRMKARYDYGLLVFILTFCMVSVSGYRDHELINMARERVVTILIGVGIALFVCICICPAWAGDDLHKQVAGNIDKLGDFLEGFGAEYLGVTGDQGESNKEKMQGFKSVLNSKQNEITLANFARWEPRHGKFRFRHPWKQYLKVGNSTRQCGYLIEALSNHLNSDIQLTPQVRSKIEEGCMKLSLETGKALKELATGIRDMTAPSSSAEMHIANSKVAANNLTCALKEGRWEDLNLAELIPAATVALLLVDVVSCTEKIAESVHELAIRARFKKVEPGVMVEETEIEIEIEAEAEAEEEEVPKQQPNKMLEKLRTMTQCSSIRSRGGSGYHVISVGQPVTA